ncbi:MAG: ATP synthase F1 subunit epsilon [Elusimicrobia bacterium RIFOXYA2_FULL_58_8]|nr:MAG: ATP synthase F1 subunit epsilon [Elusimicrobia bacterium RIFOXYA12_FULL_57_11]OGS14074.1 MAG: ATP synthase F1 subunit epsilon [Elusimicrobia bacterium RIFOXYA2_FULL_58_8]
MEKKRLILTIVTPERTVLADKPVDFVTIPAVGGELGVLPGHASFVVQLKEGFMHYTEGRNKELFAVLSGFAEIHGNKVMVLAEAAELAHEVDEERARQAYQKAKDSLAIRGADLDLDEANASLRRAAVRLKMAEFRRRHKM